MLPPLLRARTTLSNFSHRPAAASSARRSNSTTGGGGGGGNGSNDSSRGGAAANDRVVVRLVSINDVYSLTNLPRLATFLSTLGCGDDAATTTTTTSTTTVNATNGASSADATPQPQSERPFPPHPRPSAICLSGDFISPSTLSSIDGGYGHVSTLRSAGITHASLGNHEADVKLEVLRRRVTELGRSAVLLNGNVAGWLETNAGGTFNAASSFQQRSTAEFDVVQSDCGRVRVGLTGLLSDEPGMFRDGTFRGLPIQDVMDRYSEIRDNLVRTTDATVLVPLTHQSLGRDLELAGYLVGRGLSGVIIGGHEHEVHLERVESDGGNDAAAGEEKGEDCAETTTSNGTAAANNSNDQKRSSVTIVKTGQDADRAAVIDLLFDPASRALDDVHVHLEELGGYDPCPIVQRVADRHLKVLDEMEDSTVVDVRVHLPSYFGVDEAGNDDNSSSDADNREEGAAGDAAATTSSIVPTLSSERSRYQQTTVGALFCQAIKTELETDACIINGAPIKASRSYPTGTMSHGQLKEELPFPLKMVTVEMTRGRLREAIEYSRTQIEEGKGDGKGADESKGKDGKNADENDRTVPGTNNNIGEATEVERRGYLQTDFDYIKAEEDRGNIHDRDDDSDETILVALPRNLMGGFCKIEPLMELGRDLKARGRYPEKDDYMKAIDLIVRFCCKERWANVVDGGGGEGGITFEDIDLNNDGVLDREEIRLLMKDMMGGEEPSAFLVDDMISAVDTDHNGVISRAEFEQLLETVKRRRRAAPESG